MNLLEMYRILALEFYHDYLFYLSFIADLEALYLGTKQPEIKECLFYLYKERDYNGNKAQHYRTLYNTAEGRAGTIAWPSRSAAQTL